MRNTWEGKGSGADSNQRLYERASKVGNEVYMITAVAILLWYWRASVAESRKENSPAHGHRKSSRTSDRGVAKGKRDLGRLMISGHTVYSHCFVRLHWHFALSSACRIGCWGCRESVQRGCDAKLRKEKKYCVCLSVRIALIEMVFASLEMEAPQRRLLSRAELDVVGGVHGRRFRTLLRVTCARRRLR